MRNNKKPRVVIDTNVWLSGLIFGGQPGRLLKLFADDAILVVISEELLSELRRIITRKFPLYVPQLALLEASLPQDAELVKLGGQTIHASRDPDDNKVVETAIIGKCHYIISGDEDLLAIDSYRDIRVIKPAEFLQIENLH